MPYLSPASQSLPYQSDPDDRAGNTSRSGALAIADDAASLRERYMRFLYTRGGFGATDQEAADAIGISRTTLIPRRHELGDHVVYTERKRSHQVRGRKVGNKVYALAVFIHRVEPIDARRIA